jgi:hypothetical protein
MDLPPPALYVTVKDRTIAWLAEDTLRFLGFRNERVRLTGGPSEQLGVAGLVRVSERERAVHQLSLRFGHWSPLVTVATRIRAKALARTVVGWTYTVDS